LNFEVNPEALAGTIGAPTAEHVVLAGALLAAVPAGVAENVRDPIGAVGVVYGLLISRDPAIRTAQLERLGQAASPAVTAATQKAMVMLNAVEGRRRLPLAGLAIRSLKSLSPAEYERFHENIHALIAADDNVDLFEFTLQRMILRHLAPAFGQRREGSRVRVRKLGPLMTSCRDLLSCLAYWGSYDVLDQDQAYRKAVAQLAGDPDRAPAMLARKECSVELVGRALDDVAAATPELKKIVMNACVTCIAADGRTSIEEAELLQAIADALDLPLPPIV